MVSFTKKEKKQIQQNKCDITKLPQKIQKKCLDQQ